MKMRISCLNSVPTQPRHGHQEFAKNREAGYKSNQSLGVRLEVEYKQVSSRHGPERHRKDGAAARGGGALAKWKRRGLHPDRRWSQYRFLILNVLPKCLILLRELVSPTKPRRTHKYLLNLKEILAAFLCGMLRVFRILSISWLAFDLKANSGLLRSELEW